MQDSKGYIWAATDNGLVRYDGKTFSPIPSNININPSFTSLYENSEGQIWCLGFPYNIMYVDGDSLYRLVDFASLTVSYPIIHMNNDILSVAIDSGFYRYHTVQKHWIDTLPFSGYFHRKNRSVFINPTENAAHETRALNATFDSVTYISPPYSIEGIKLGGFFKEIEGKLIYFYNQNTGIVIPFEIRNDSALLFEPLQWLDTDRIIRSFKSKRDSNILYLATNNGLQGIQPGFKPLFSKHLLEDYSVSMVFEDVEGNIWMSTTQQGLFIFPNLRIPYFTPKNSAILSADIAHLASDGQHLYIGLKNGNIQRLDNNNQFQTVFEYNNNRTFLRFMEYNPFQKTITFSLENTCSYFLEDKSIKTFSYDLGGLLHDISFIDSNSILTSGRQARYISSQGKTVPLLIESQSNDRKLYLEGKNSSYTIAHIRSKKTLCNAYTPHTETYWVSYSDGLYFYRNQQVHQFQYNNQTVKALDIEVDQDGNTWIASTNGLHQIDSAGKHKYYNTEDGLFTHMIKRVICNNHNIYLIYQDGFQIYNYKSKRFKTFTQADGIPSSEIRDIEVLNDNIYVATAKGLIVFPINYNPHNEQAPFLHFTGFFVNDIPQKLQSYYALDHNENNLRLTFDVIAHRSLGHKKIKYRLKGSSNEWITESQLINNLRFSALGPGNYTLEIMALNEDNSPSPIQTIKFTIFPPFYKTWWFAGICMAILGLLTFAWYYRRIQKVQQEAEIQGRLVRSEMTAIKSQMNPHFIFNALNSIQDLILKKDIRSSNKFLVKFSTLIREVLKLSSEEYITLESELNLLNLYIDLEKLRFGEDLEVLVHCDLQEYDSDDLYIPPLLIQPYIENAFKHGLLHKKGSKKIILEFKISTHHLCCIVEDNGVGRKRSQAINQRRSQHQSFATHANQKRIDLLNATHQQQIELNVIDLPNESGTRVEILFPIVTNTKQL